MTERRETGRAAKSAGKSGKRPQQARKRESDTPIDWSEGERIAKYLARCGVASRRECEALIEAGKVSVNDQRLTSPAFKVTGRETIRVNRKVVRPPEPTRLWRYHKPAGLLTTTTDPEGRPTIYEALPKSLPRTVTVGRLDFNTEGLLLLTNDGELARALELPKNEISRKYRARAHGKITQVQLDTLKDGITVDGVDYAPIEATLERTTGANNWINVTLTEGKKREVRRALESLDMQVNRLIRIDYGPFSLGDLKPGAVEEVAPGTLVSVIGPLIPEGHRPDGRAKPPGSKASAAKARAASRLGRRRGSSNVGPKGKR